MKFTALVCGRLGTAPSKEPTWNYKPIFPGSVPGRPTRVSLVDVHGKKRRYTESTWQLKGCRLEKQIARFKRAIAAASSSDTNRDTPATANEVASSWHGGYIAANCRAFHLGKPLKTLGLKTYRTSHGVGGPIKIIIRE